MRAKDRVYVALLRGINVGGKNKLPMAELRELFEDAGCARVRTYIQSGNVLFTASSAVARRVPSVIPESIFDRFGYRVPVVIRKASELAGVAARNPFLEQDADERVLYVAFLAARPTTARIRTLDPVRSLPDRFVVRGREIFLYCPNGVARTRLTNAHFDSQLKTTCTVRNWRTVLNLLELTRT